jgi:hypothetical protein
MKTETIGQVTVVYDPAEQETADLIAGACEKALQIAQADWGLDPPGDCRIHVMTSWWDFVFQSAPWSWKVLLGATVPFWVFRVRRTWPYSAAWTQRYGKRIAIGVKPPRLLEQSDRSIGVRIYVEEKDMRINVQNVTCHELVHACSAHLRLTTWLNEGIAVVSTDRFQGRPTIREETLAFIRDFEPKAPPPTYRELSRMDLEAIAYHGVRGYWIALYLEKTHPGLLRRMFSQGQDGQAIERAVIAELGMEPEQFWQDIDGLATDHFGREGNSRSGSNPNAN